MTFTDTGRLGQSVEVYLKLNKTEEIHDSPMLDNSIVMESEKRETIKEEMKTLSQAGRFISQQYYLSYLNNFHAGEVRSALFDLHRYFDYKKWDEDQMAGNGENALEKHQMKFKRFRYCALNLGIFHFYHGHYKVSLAALEEAVKMAQETNDNHCLLHALFWLYQLKLESEPGIASTMLAQFNRRAVELSSAGMRALGILLECKSDVFGGKCSCDQILKKLKVVQAALTAKHAVSTRNIEVARSAFLDFFGYRPVASTYAQMVLHNIKQPDQATLNTAFLYGPLDPESSILALCQFARFLADEGYYLDAQRVLAFGNTLIAEHSILHKWIILCKWQLIFDRCVLRRDLNSIDDVIQPISVLDKYDAKFKECVIHYLRGNMTTASSRIEELLSEVENRQQLTVGNTPGAVYMVRLLQLKAELLAASDDVPKAVTYLIKCADICRRFNMKTLEGEITISIAQCKIRLGLPHHAKQILNQQMLHTLAYGTSYARSFIFVVLAKASLFGMKGELKASKAEILQQIPSLEKSLERFQILEAVAAQSEVLFLLAQIYNLLDYTKKRNHYAKEYRLIHESYT
eukprot:gene10528-19255_t